MAPPGQLLGDAGLAVGAVELAMDGTDRLEEGGLGQLGLVRPGGLGGLPVVEGGG